jgi:hypothetical protein
VTRVDAVLIPTVGEPLATVLPERH